MQVRNTQYAILLITFLALFLRVWQLDGVPPGYSDDELSNVLVISQKSIQGDWSVYYNDATGLEALYHVISAGFLTLIGYNPIGIRFLSAILGTLAVPLTYQVARRLFNRHLALIASAALAVSFWSLIYSRINLRHIILPVFMLVTFYHFTRWIKDGGRRTEDRRNLLTANGQPPATSHQPLSTIHYPLTTGLLLGLSLYTYFASRGLPLILLAFIGYLAIFHWAAFKQRWQSFVIMFVVAGVVAIPLLVTISQQTGADARVSEVAVPLTQALEGNYDLLQEHIIRTVNMFHSDGDDEFLYNIPFRPVFNPLGAVFFWLGIAVCLWHVVRGAWNVIRSASGQRLIANSPLPTTHYPLSTTFLLLWWLAGISPGFISVPAGSLGHTIIAQPVTYIIATLPIVTLHRYLPTRWRPLTLVLTLLFVGNIAQRDLPDYFTTWAKQGNTRFLYHADQANVADFVLQSPEFDDFSVTGLLSGPWDKLALLLELGQEPWDVAPDDAPRPRWYNPERALILQPNQTFSGYPANLTPLFADQLTLQSPDQVGGYQLYQVDFAPSEQDAPICFINGLCLLASTYSPEQQTLDLLWHVAQPLDLPPIPIISKPPPPDTYDGPRLHVFAQLLDPAGQFITGDDGLWVDPTTLQVGDVFVQQHRFVLPAGANPTTLHYGLYDPLTTQRIPTTSDTDSLQQPLTP